MSTDFGKHVMTRSGLPQRERLEPATRTAHRDALMLADRACCCSAKPAVVAVMPPASGGQHATELLLCGHHYRASREALAAAGASVFGKDGMLITAQCAALVGAR